MKRCPYIDWPFWITVTIFEVLVFLTFFFIAREAIHVHSH